MQNVQLQGPEETRWCSVSTTRLAFRPSSASTRDALLPPEPGCAVVSLNMFVTAPRCSSPRSHVHTGQVLAECRERPTEGNDILVAFMERVAIAYPDKQVHVVWDNLNTHRAQAVRHAFNARHGKRFHFHFTPLHASWVNQI